ncbi:MAG: cytochrome c oxidase subunit II [Alphaproteobacteria bacterium]|nr:MAG: cytochrome c oxidase subunit II [Alphaproteobacteria bacterium]
MLNTVNRKFFLCLALFFPLQETLCDAPKDWQIGFQPAASPVMEQLTSFHNLMLIITGCIGGFVIFLIGWVSWRYRASKNPTPETWSHNTLLEVVWTAIPVVILLFMAYPSFKLLYYMDAAPKADMTIKAIGKQWYWTYEYPDHGNFSFDSYMIPDKDLKPHHLRLLSVDNPVYVPVGKKIRVLTTANDVIHSWALPAMGVKKDCVPGRINETWFMATKPGIYYGQCSELCGPQHGMMPIEVHVVSEKEFDAWITEARKKYE